MKPWLCTYFNYAFLNLCIPEENGSALDNKGHNAGGFQVHYQWTHLNYTWESPEQYATALQNGRYIPENNAPVGMKIYKDYLFLSVPRFRKGIPATLTYLKNDQASPTNPLLSPFPGWASNDDVTSCLNLQSVQSMEVDTKGVMWVIDGVRINNYTGCPPKLMLFDLNDWGRLLHTHVFPNEICLQEGGFLNDLVIDESDGGFAYITDNSPIDPGIIIYSKWKDRSWKLRDTTIYPEPKASNFPVEETIFSMDVPVDGIALSPRNTDGKRTLFYTALTGFTLYAVPTDVVKNEGLVKSGTWRRSVENLGPKISQSDGMIMDEHSNLYYTLLPHYGVATWNTNRPIWTQRILDANRETMVWPDGFAFDETGFLYLISNHVFRYVNPDTPTKLDGNIVFRVLKFYSGTRSYLYG